MTDGRNQRSSEIRIDMCNLLLEIKIAHIDNNYSSYSILARENIEKFQHGGDVLLRNMIPALVLALWSTETRAIDWESHALLTEAGRPLLVSTSDGSADAQTIGETSSLFRRITADGTECEAKDGKTRRIRIVCTAKGTHSVSVYIGKIVGAGQFLIQQVAINTRMLPAAERVAHVKNLLSHE